MSSIKQMNKMIKRSRISIISVPYLKQHKFLCADNDKNGGKELTNKNKKLQLTLKAYKKNKRN